MRGFAAVATSAILWMVAGCDRIPLTPQHQAAEAVRALMIDPPAARVKLIAQGAGGFCGSVNGKNAMGGYTGERPFVALAAGGMNYRAQVYRDPPSMDDIRLLAHEDNGPDRDELVLRIDQDCGLPELWRKTCGLEFPMTEGDAHMCGLWRENRMHELFDEVDR